MSFVPGVDVIIAGAGPVGLFLAGELRLRGCSVLVIERDSDPASPLKGSPFGLRGLTPPTLDALGRRGLLDPLRARAATRGGKAHWEGAARRPAGHFAGITLFEDRTDADRTPGIEAAPLATTIADLDAVLTGWTVSLGVVVRRGAAVDGVEPGDHGVAVRVGGDTIRARWLVGCDGGRSAVRKAAGIGFAGTEPELTGYALQVRLADAAPLRAGRHHTPGGFYTYTPPGVFAVAEYDGGRGHRAAVTRADAEALLRRVTVLDLRVAALDGATTWTDRAFLADQYRCGRVLLAGDAAHVHSPLGGQGLNLGIGDAADLAPRLAAVMADTAPADELDGYEAARRPVAAAVLDWSRAQVALMRPDPGTAALRSVVAALADTRDGATYLAGRLRGVGM